MSGFKPTAMSVQYRHANSSLSTPQAITVPTALSGTGTVTITNANAFDPDLTYTFLLTLTDTQGEYTASKSTTSAPYTIHCRPGGKGIAFGKTSELENYAEFGFEVCMNNNASIRGRDLEGNPINAFQAVNSNGNTIVGYGNYDKGRKGLLGASGTGYTNIYGHDVHIGVSNIASPGTYRPYRRQGDTLNVTVQTAGYVTGGGADVSFMVPIDRPIIGSPTVSVSTTTFKLRQGTKYTHGCNDDTKQAIPTSITATRTTFNGLRITAHFENTTDVTNNDAIGVHWSGTITLGNT
jgi:hypothetical protein